MRRDDGFWAMIAESVAAARRGDPVPCSGCGTSTPRDQLREGSVPARVVDFGDYDIVVDRIGHYCPACQPVFSSPT